MSEYGGIPDESEQLDQMQSDDTLIDRGVDDVLDEGYTAPERWSVFMRGDGTRGDSIDQRLSEEEPDVDIDDEWDPDEDQEVGHSRAGRIVSSQGGWDEADTESEALAEDVGLDGGAASAEEAAVHLMEG
ncbi:MAG: DUF5709 domain-containing protein [Propionibacteriaceae bacterium]|jgi:hypothetical protein|nr:DUF5709 domain-containing protein [Propionibacteriaceae bacterium]